MLPKFIPNIVEIDDTSMFVDIFLMVNSNTKSIKKYTSFKTKIIYSIQVFRSSWRPKIFTLAWFIKYVTFPFWFIKTKFTTTEALEILDRPDNSNINFIINFTISRKKRNRIYKYIIWNYNKRFFGFQS